MRESDNGCYGWLDGRGLLSEWQRIAIERWTLIPEEQARPSFSHVTAAGTFVLTVRAGWG